MSWYCLAQNHTLIYIRTGYPLPPSAAILTGVGPVANVRILNADACACRLGNELVRYAIPVPVRGFGRAPIKVGRCRGDAGLDGGGDEEGDVIGRGSADSGGEEIGE